MQSTATRRSSLRQVRRLAHMFALRFLSFFRTQVFVDSKSNCKWMSAVTAIIG